MQLVFYFVEGKTRKINVWIFPLIFVFMKMLNEELELG